MNGNWDVIYSSGLGVWSVEYGSSDIVVVDTHDDGDDRRRRYQADIDRKAEQRYQLESLFGLHPIAELPEPVQVAVKPYVPRKQKAKPVAQVAKWDLLMADETAMRRLVDEYAVWKAGQDEDDFIVTMLLN